MNLSDFRERRPRPERLRKWQQVSGYRDAPVASRGPVCVTAYRVPPATPAGHGMRVAFASDFHYDGSPADRRRMAATAALLRETRPDYLCFGGDLSADAIDLDRLPELLALFEDVAPVKVAIPGNWERGKDWLDTEFWESLYGAHGIRYLCNTAFEDDAFYIYGCDESARGTPRLPTVWPEGKTHIVLAHRPDTVIELDAFHRLGSVRLILCGHTHGGQIRLPWIGPLYASSSYGCRLAYGMFARRHMPARMIVSSGVSHRSFKFRFNCRREIVTVDFDAEAAGL